MTIKPPHELPWDPYLIIAQLPICYNDSREGFAGRFSPFTPTSEPCDCDSTLRQ